MDGENPWRIGSKSNYIESEVAFYVEPLNVQQFDKYDLEGSVYRFAAKDYPERFPEMSDLTGYMSIDTSANSEITFSSTITKNKMTS